MESYGEEDQRFGSAEHYQGRGRERGGGPGGRSLGVTGRANALRALVRKRWRDLGTKSLPKRVPPASSTIMYTVRRGEIFLALNGGSYSGCSGG